MIHTASLVHDDVIDGSDQRRGKSTINDMWDKDFDRKVLYYKRQQLFKIVNLLDPKLFECIISVLYEHGFCICMNCSVGVYGMRLCSNSTPCKV